MDVCTRVQRIDPCSDFGPNPRDKLHTRLHLYTATGSRFKHRISICGPVALAISTPGSIIIHARQIRRIVRHHIPICSATLRRLLHESTSNVINQPLLLDFSGPIELSSAVQRTSHECFPLEFLARAATAAAALRFAVPNKLSGS